MRDKENKVIMAFCIPLGRGDNNYAEASAFLFGLNGCIQNGHSRIIGKLIPSYFEIVFRQLGKPMEN